MTVDVNTLTGGMLSFLGNPITPASNLTWGFFISVLVIIYFISISGGK